MAVITGVGRQSGLPYAIEFDATIEEELLFSSNVTRSPREAGTSSTDHVEPLPDVVRLTGLVTNTPVQPYSAGAGATNADGQLPIVSAFLPATYTTSTEYLAQTARVSERRFGYHVPGVPPRLLGSKPTVQPAVWQRRSESLTYRTLQTLSGTKVDRVYEVLRALRALASEGTEFALQTRYVTFPTMLISSVSCPTTAVDAMAFSIEFVQSNIALVATTDVVAFKNVDETRKNKNKTNGAKPPDPIDPGLEDYEQMQSLYLSGVESIADAVQ